MQQHDDDTAPSEVPRPRRRSEIRRPAWPFPSGPLTPTGDGPPGTEVDPAPPGSPAGQPGAVETSAAFEVASVHAADRPVRGPRSPAK